MKSNFDQLLFSFSCGFILGVGITVVRFYDVVMYELGIV